jgi:hypothetical protein
MFDSRTRYSQEVLDRVQEKFDDKVFDTVVRYNIRLRETVDHGLPIGDYDKHAIGQKDYDALSEEVMNSARKDEFAETEASSQAEEILRTAQEYLDAMEPVPMSDDESKMEKEIADVFPFPAQSSYSAMINAIAAGAGPEWSDEGEETEN